MAGRRITGEPGVQALLIPPATAGRQRTFGLMGHCVFYVKCEARHRQPQLFKPLLRAFDGITIGVIRE